MDTRERENHAERIARQILENADYSYVCEDEELEDASEDDWRAIHDLIQRDMYALLYP